MESYEDDDDTHFCIKCHLTINGLENYVRHRQSGCRPSDDKSEAVHDPPSTPTTVSYPEILNADAFFSSLELQSSSKTNPRRASALLDRSRKSGKLEDRKRKARKEKSPDDAACKEKQLPSLPPVVADLDDPTDHLGIPSLVGFPDIVTSTGKPASTVTSAKLASTHQMVSASAKIDNPGFHGKDEVGQDSSLERKRQEESQSIRQDQQEAWLEDTMLTDLVGNNETKDLTHTELNRFVEFGYHQEEDSDELSLDDDSCEDDSFSDSDETEDRQFPPRDHTGGKWKPGLSNVPEHIAHEHEDDEIDDEQHQEHPPPSYTGGKWKPTESSVQKAEEYESKDTAGQPPPGHTRGKWVPGAQTDIGTGYWCNPCGRKLASRLVYNRHLLSDLHARRSVQEIDGDLHLPRGTASLIQRKISRRRRAATLKVKEVEEVEEQETKKRLRRREKAVVTCEMCLARVRRVQMGKHLLSHYHCRVSGASPRGTRAREFLLENMVNVVRQCPFQCAICRFYCNTEETFLMHWRSPLHMEALQQISGSYKCTACNFRCEDNDAMETHLLSRGHRDVVSMMNGSVPVVIRRQRILSCNTCKLNFRYNLQLRIHQKRTKHDVDRSASDEYQIRLICDVCGDIFRSQVALQRHQLSSHMKESEKPELQQSAPYFCSFCSLTFKTAKQAVLHRRTLKHKETVKAQKSSENTVVSTMRKCPHCEMNLLDLTEFREHLLKCHLEFCYRCPKCGMSFALSQDVTKHSRENQCDVNNPERTQIRVFDDDNQWKCAKCAFCTDSEAEFLFHESLHAGTVESVKDEAGSSKRSEKYKCLLCQKAFGKVSLRDHIRAHTGERPFPCVKCRAAFSTRGQLNVHRKICSGASSLSWLGQNDRQRNHICNVCKDAFYTKHTLQQHMLRHAGKKYKCGLPGCPTVLRTEAELKSHRALVHEAVDAGKRFKCADCSYSPKTKAQLRRHRQKHEESTNEEGLNLHTCQYSGCGFRTRISSHLKRHMRLHTGTKPYKCRHCSYSSNNLENLRKHVLSTSLHPGKTIYECSSCSARSRDPFGTNFAKELRAHLLEEHPDEYPTPNHASEHVSRIFDTVHESRNS